jgi:hypothetical protein
MSDERLIRELGEVKGILHAHSHTLDKIEKAVEQQNGRVQKLEVNMARLKAVWTVLLVAGGLLVDSFKHKLGL